MATAVNAEVVVGADFEFGKFFSSLALIQRADQILTGSYKR